MRIVIAGGSGNVGSMLARAYHERADNVIVLSRQPAAAPWKTVYWDGRSIGPWVSELDGADVVVNLAGRSVNCRYTAKNRREILSSRVESTRIIGLAIANAASPPRVWLQASTATIYAHRFDAPNDEATGILGGNEPDAPASWRFSIDVARAWEDACAESVTPATRKVILRSAMIMSPEAGGVFSALLGLVRHGLGGRAGDGRQYVSWIHDRDFVAAIDLLIENLNVAGAVNLASPNPLRNETFMRDLRRAAGVRFGLPTPRPLLEFGARLMQTESELVLKSRRVVPGRLLGAHFSFAYPEWPAAAEDLCKRHASVQNHA